MPAPGVQTYPLPLPNLGAPLAVVITDTLGNAIALGTGTASGGGSLPTAAGASTGIQAVAQQAGYTAISTIGTATLKAAAGVFYGFTSLATGTAAMNVQVLDGANVIYPAVAQGALGGFQGPAGAALGIKCTTSIIVVTTGTAGTINALWD